MSLMTAEELAERNFAFLGKNVRISTRASFYGADNIVLGDNVRIDDFCVLSAGRGGIRIGNYVHVAVFSSLMGAAPITISDFSNISSRVSIYSSSDDYSGGSLTNPTVAGEYSKVQHAPVFFGKHVIVGSGSVVLPGVTLEDGVAIGALSLANRSCEAFGIYAGVPIRRIRDRSQNLLELEKDFLRSRAVKVNVD